MSILGRWREAAMMSYPGRFAGKTAMVTGAAQGIGRAFRRMADRHHGSRFYFSLSV